MRQSAANIENNFTGGLKTEFTGLNFPENACTDTANCIFSRAGNVTRRMGLNYETNRTLTTIDRDGKGISTFKWDNVSGADVQLYVLQIGSTLHFFRSSSATVANPLSDQKLASTITISTYLASGGTYDSSLECQYSEGKGYLFVFHPNCEPFYCTYSAGTITATQITVKIRDTLGIDESEVEDSLRPLTLTDNHQYNLANQGWQKGWVATSTSSVDLATGSRTFVVAEGLPILVGDRLLIAATIDEAGSIANSMTGIVTAYSGTSLTVTCSAVVGGAGTYDLWNLTPKPPLVYNWYRAIGNYPSNSDSWWFFKNSDEEFDPADTIDDVSAAAGPAPKGYYLLSAWRQLRTTVSGIPNLADATTLARPQTGCWFQGRVWYAGLESSIYTETLYFSQIVEKITQVGLCYQANDPTSEERFDLLPSDGGTIQIQGMGQVYKLFPLQTGLIVFAANGIWHITGSTGVGFTATDYTVTKLSAIKSISGTSFVSILGFPMWWTQEGIYSVSPTESGGLGVSSVTDKTIASFYADIPFSSHKRARGDYNPITGVVQWLYRSTEASGTVVSRYEFDRILNLNTQTGAFYPWSFSGTPKIVGVNFVSGFGDSTSPASQFKYATSTAISGPSYNFTFSDETATTFTDWAATTAVNYTSYTITGYKLHGDAQRKFQSNYVYVFSGNEEDTSYKIQGVWNYATSGNSGKYSALQRVDLDTDNFRYLYRRHKIRGHGVALQFRITSVDGEPFDIIGWSVWETVNAKP